MLSIYEFLRRKESKMKKVTVLVLSVLVPIASFAQVKRVLVYDYQPKLEAIFTEPFEVMAIYTGNGKTITMTSHLENRVNVSLQEIEYYLNIVDSDLESTKIIVHNHPIPIRWSLQDNKFYHKLKSEGFKGQFVLYFPWCKSLRYMGEQKEVIHTDAKTKAQNPQGSHDKIL